MEIWNIEAINLKSLYIVLHYAERAVIKHFKYLYVVVHELYFPIINSWKFFKTTLSIKIWHKYKGYKYKCNVWWLRICNTCLVLKIRFPKSWAISSNHNHWLYETMYLSISMKTDLWQKEKFMVRFKHVVKSFNFIWKLRFDA